MNPTPFRNVQHQGDKMKKIGTTSSGTVIIEMSTAQFDALMQIHTPQQTPPAQPPAPQPTPAPKTQPAAPAAKTVSPAVMTAAAKDSASSMTPAQLVDYVAKRIGKLKPKKKDALIHSIETMFRMTGGIDALGIERVIAGLQKSKFITVDAAGKVAYREP
jgi:hypothetical protein